MPFKFLKFLFFFLLLSCFLFTDKLNAQNFAGRIFLQVEQNGEAWYVNPLDNLRYFLGRPSDAFGLMKSLGLGISNESFRDFEKNNAPERLAGRILLKVESAGEAYYVDSESLKMLYMGRPLDAFALMREKGIGITDLNLERISIAQNFNVREAKDTMKLFEINDYCISELEIDLADKINKYRELKKLPAIPISKSLSYTAKIHLIDLIENNPVTKECNAHSWSGKGIWEECCYPLDSDCIQSKASELTEYSADVAENIHWWEDAFHTPSPQGALDGWIESHGHHIVIINEEWARDFEWKALGVAIYKNYAAMWVGPEADTLAGPEKCETCREFQDKKLEYDCFSNKAIFFADKNYCGFIENSLEQEHCIVRADIYSCSAEYREENFDCYRELVKENELICDYIYKSKEDIDNCYKFSRYNK